MRCKKEKEKRNEKYETIREKRTHQALTAWAQIPDSHGYYKYVQKIMLKK